MKKLWRKYRLILFWFILWEALLLAMLRVAPFLRPLNTRFLGDIALSNFDGVYYLTIARGGYGIFQQAFFPFYPLLIKWISAALALRDVSVAVAISHVSFLLGLFLFYDLATSINKAIGLWSVVFLMFFPTSFFFGAVYSESIFFFLSVLCVWSIRHRRWGMVGMSGLLAGMTRLFGIFLFPLALWEYAKLPASKRTIRSLASLLLVPCGLIFYMVYLMLTTGDPLAFIHVQPAFGAYRSGSSIILLPQVIWRYFKIFVTVPSVSFIYMISVFEFVSFFFGIWLVWLGLKHRSNASYFMYSLAILVVPTLTGTLSSMPRYLISAFPLFFVLASVHNTLIKMLLALLFGAGLVFFATAFFRGYFVA